MFVPKGWDYGFILLSFPWFPLFAIGNKGFLYTVLSSHILLVITLTHSRIIRTSISTNLTIGLLNTLNRLHEGHLKSS